MTADDLERLLDGLVRVYVHTELAHASRRPTPAAILFYRDHCRRMLIATLAPRRAASTAPLDLYSDDEVTPAETPTSRRRAFGHDD